MRYRNLALLAALAALLIVGGPAYLAGSSAPVVDDTEPTNFVHCSTPSSVSDLMLCGFIERAQLLGYSGTVREMFDRVPLAGGDVGFVSRGITAAPLSACDNSSDCKKAGEDACKAAGKPGPGGTWTFFYVTMKDGAVKGACSGTCPGGGAWYATCVAMK